MNDHVNITDLSDLGLTEQELFLMRVQTFLYSTLLMATL